MANPVHTQTLARLIATWGGVGLAAKAPGTFGTLAAIPLWVVMQPLGTLEYLMATLVLCLIGWWAAHRHSQALGVHDPQQVVVDEVAGLLITMVGAPLAWPQLVVGFALFRLLDITKPWPVGWLDRHVAGGLGIMADDIAAGAMAWLLSNLVFQYLEGIGGLLP